MYADPGDTLLGIGMSMNDRDVCDEERWRGGNILGSVLTAIRNELLSRITVVYSTCIAVMSVVVSLWYDWIYVLAVLIT